MDADPPRAAARRGHHRKRTPAPLAEDPLTIGIVAPPWLPVPPPAYGGTESVLDVLARGLVAAGHRVVLFASGDSTCPVERRWFHPVAVGVGRGGVVDEVCQVVEAYRALREVGVDVVHDHTVAGPLYAYGLGGPPVVTTNHGPFGPELVPIYRAVADQIGIIAISHHQASTAGGLRLAGVVHHGLDVERVPVGAGRGGYALFLGRMHPDKGIDVAIGAARAAGMPLRIAAKMSEPAERRYFDDAIAPLLGGDVTFVGEVDWAAKVALLGDACCLLNPVQWDEPFGMVVAEALACGTPVVASDRGSLPELVDHGRTGFVCPDHDALVAAVRRVGSIDRAQCRRDAEQRYSSRRMVEEHVRIYRRAIQDATGLRSDLIVGTGDWARRPVAEPVGQRAGALALRGHQREVSAAAVGGAGVVAPS